MSTWERWELRRGYVRVTWSGYCKDAHTKRKQANRSCSCMAGSFDVRKEVTKSESNQSIADTSTSCPLKAPEV